MLESIDRIAPNTNSRGLTETQRGELSDRFIGQRTGARHHTDAALFVDVSRHDADLDFIGRDQTRTVRSKQERLAARLGHFVFEREHVTHGDAFGDADGQIQLGLNRFPDCIGSTCRRYVDNGDVCARLFFGFAHVGINRYAFKIFAGLFRIDASDKAFFAIRIVAAHARMELPGFTGNALSYNLGVFIDQNRHDVSLRN